MLKTFFLSLAALLSMACTSLDSGFKYVDCTGVYTVNTFPDIGKTITVKVDAIRVDRVGVLHVRPKSSLNIRFPPGFKPKDLLTNYMCTGESYGLTS